MVCQYPEILKIVIFDTWLGWILEVIIIFGTEVQFKIGYGPYHSTPQLCYLIGTIQ